MNLLKNYYKKVNVPNDFYIEYTEFLHKSTVVWEEAKKNNDYNIFKPYLEKVIELTKKYYSYINFDEDLYDVIENERFIFEGVVYNPSKKVREIMAAGIGAILNGLPVADNKSAL